MNPETLPCVLLTGFEPFDGEPVNASWEVVRALEGATLGGHRIVTRCLPSTFTKAFATLESAMREQDPAAVVAVGQAGGRGKISLERVAINLIDARIPDNDGAQPIDEPVVPGAPNAYFSTLPIKAMLLALQEAGHPAEISYTAGSYVCNQVFFALCHALRERPDIPAGFVHLPFLDIQAPRHPGKPSLRTETLVEALKVMLHAVFDPPRVVPGTSAGTEA